MNDVSGGLDALATWTRAYGNPKAWLMAFMSAAFVEMASLFIPLCGIVGFSHLSTTGTRLVLRKIHDPLQALHASKLGFFAITAAIFALMDFVIMIYYLTMCLKSI